MELRRRSMSPPVFEAPYPNWGTRGMTACDHPQAATAAAEVLAGGGNAVDAAVTLSLTLGVLCPQYTGIGGGGFMMVWLPEMERPVVLDYRETAPGAAYPGMYSARAQASARGPLAIGVPGTMAGLAALLERFGTISMERALAPGIELAEKGFAYYPNLRRILLARRKLISIYKEAARIFLGPSREGPRPGDVLRQPDLARTYRRLAQKGWRDFYEGETAELMVREMKRSGGILSAEDLSAYQPIWREPLSGVYRGQEIYVLPPPSGGGIQLLQMLGILEPFRFSPSRMGSSQTYHLQAEAMKIAFAERSTWVADPAFFPVPVEAMLDPARIAELHVLVNPKEASSVGDLPPLPDLPLTAPERTAVGTGGTASFAAADARGGLAVATESINLWFGSMVVPAGTGFVMNDIMDDFSRRPGTPDAFGLVSSRANQVEPGKRPASSSCPVIVAREDQPYLALGSAGGPRIPTSVLQILMNLIDHQSNLRQAQDAPRVHHQWLPDETHVEKAVPEDVRRGLRQLGHRVLEGPNRSHSAAVMWSESEQIFYGAGDFRSGGAAAGV
ncbi:MAG: gamma-glutamyltransferase [Candidatus Xenobia bacterium]